jgi:DNA-binding transcriptional LysR family regulator
MPGMDLSSMESFVLLCRQGSYTRAAEGLFISQSALSKRIAALERELGLSLVERRDGVVVPTREGEVLLARCEEMLRQRDETLRQMRGLRDGSSALLRVGYLATTPLAVMAPAVARMAREHPQTELAFREVPDGADPCDEVRRGRQDAVVSLEERAHPTPDAPVRLFRRLRYCVLAGAGTPFSRRASCAPGDLVGHPVVLYTGSEAHGYHTMARYLASVGCDARQMTYAESHAQMVLLVSTGCYLSLGALDVGMPEEQVPDQVVRVPLVGCDLSGGNMVVAYDAHNAAACAFARML